MDYSSLKTSIAAFLHRENDANVLAQVPTFISLREARFNRTLRTPYQEKRAYYTLTTEFTSFPLDFVQMRTLIDQTTGEAIEYVSPGNFQRIKARNQPLTTLPSGNTHYIFTMEDMQFRVLPVPTVSAPLVMEILYYAVIPALSDSNTTNWLLTSHPDLYLFGSLITARDFVVTKPEVAAVWDARYKEAEAQLSAQSTLERREQLMVVRPDSKPYQQSVVTY